LQNQGSPITFYQQQKPAQSHSDYKEEGGRLRSYPGAVGCWSTGRGGHCQQEEQTGRQSPAEKRELFGIHKVSSPHFLEEIDYE